jgi:hypothetical protein
MKYLLANYKNGNAVVSLFSNGTRIIECNDSELKLEYPLNIDIRVQSKCPLGLNPKTGRAICSFCHESATTDGKECDYEKLKEILSDLPKGIELAIGYNHNSGELWKFLEWCRDKGFICNITVNQLLAVSIFKLLEDFTINGLIKGLGISFRRLDHTLVTINNNSVVHVIAGIDSIQDVKQLPSRGVKKILVLGEKDFGFNKGKVDLTTKKHKEWLWQVRDLFDMFEVVSFDNLALEQLKIKRFIQENLWEEMYQHEHSFYINAVDQYFSPSSRSKEKTNFKPIKEYYNEINQKKRI